MCSVFRGGSRHRQGTSIAREAYRTFEKASQVSTTDAVNNNIVNRATVQTFEWQLLYVIQEIHGASVPPLECTRHVRASRIVEVLRGIRGGGGGGLSTAPAALGNVNT